MRHQAVKAVLAKANRAILILPIYDQVTTEYNFLLKQFTHVIDIGRNYKMVMRPTAHQVVTDNITDYFTIPRSKSIISCWVLTKGFELETLMNFATGARGVHWGEEREEQTRFISAFGDGSNFIPISIAHQH